MATIVVMRLHQQRVFARGARGGTTAYAPAAHRGTGII
jgi:hypothetical protein